MRIKKNVDSGLKNVFLNYDRPTICTHVQQMVCFWNMESMCWVKNGIEKCIQVKRSVHRKYSNVNSYCLRAIMALGLNLNVRCLPVGILVIKQYEDT